MYAGYCVYCGGPNQCRDHVVPATQDNTRMYGEDKCVACCNECNSLLGSRALYSVKERAGYLAETYSRRYAKVLAMPEWTKEELSEVSPKIQKLVLHNKVLKQIIEDRIKTASRVARLNLVALKERLAGGSILDQKPLEMQRNSHYSMANGKPADPRSLRERINFLLE